MAEFDSSSSKTVPSPGLRLGRSPAQPSPLYSDLLGSIVNTARESMLVLDDRLCVVLANRTFCEVFQVSEANTLGRFVYDLGDGEWNIPELRSLLGEVLPERSVIEDFAVEHSFPRIGHRHMLLNARTLRQASGMPGLILLAIEDVTERRAAEREVRLSRQLLECTLASTVEGIYSIDRFGHCTLINRAALQLLGLTEQECLGRDIHSLIHRHRSDGSPLAPTDCSFLNALTSGGTVQEHEDVFWRRDGAPLPVSVSLAAIEVGGEYVGAVVAFSDRSERERLDQERSEATSRLRLAMDAARIVTWTWHPEPQELVTSENLASIYGVASIDSVADGIALLVPEDRERHFETVSSAASRQTAYHSEFRIRRPDTGELVWLDEHAICTRAGDPRQTSFTGITLDVTEKRRNQKLLEDANSRLEESALELRRSNDDLSQFAAIAGHDLQAPLRTVSNHAQLLELRLGATLDADLAKSLNFISNAARDMHTLITSLLNYAAIGGSVQPHATVDLDRELREMLAAIQHLVEEARATVVCEKLPCVAGHAVQLRQLFQNLVVNALTYRDTSREPVIRIASSEDEAFFTIAVHDNGVGIDQQYLKLIFNPFKRLHGSERPGSGLGLAVCKRIVANHGGDLQVESTPGLGSTFLVRLPKQHTT